MFSALGPFISLSSRGKNQNNELDQYPFSSHGKRSIKPLLEGAAALENGGEQEVEERPELRELVLQWGPGQQDPPGGHVVRVQDLRQLAVVVLHAVAFIHDHVLPADLQAQEQAFRGEAGGLLSQPLGKRAPCRRAC